MMVELHTHSTVSRPTDFADSHAQFTGQQHFSRAINELNNEAPSVGHYIHPWMDSTKHTAITL
jgi:hypothetical protein